MVMFRNSPPLPEDRLYRTILLVMVFSVLAGAVIALVGELVMHNEALSEAGMWLALVSAGVYAFFRWLGVREARRRASADRVAPDNDRTADRE